MSKLEALTGKTHLSYSALDSFLTCGERFRLERIEQVPQDEAWWFIGGTAFHKATELLDTGVSKDPRECWEAVWHDAIADLPAGADIRAGGRATKEWPNKEDGAWWAVKGAEMVQAYVDWRNQSGWHLYHDNDLPAVEVPFSLDLGGVQVMGYIDRLFVNEHGELLVVDLKTGSRTPAATTQLGLYALGIEKSWGTRPVMGAYYMARKGEPSQMFGLAHYTEAVLTDWFVKVRTAVEQELFLPHVTALCQTCSVARHCYAVGGVPPTPLKFRESLNAS